MPRFEGRVRSLTADCYLRTAGNGGAALATLLRIVTEIDGVAPPAHSRTYRNIVTPVDVLRVSRVPLFVKKFCPDSCV